MGQAECSYKRVAKLSVRGLSNVPAICLQRREVVRSAPAQQSRRQTGKPATALMIHLSVSARASQFSFGNLGRMMTYSNGTSLAHRSDCNVRDHACALHRPTARLEWKGLNLT